MVKINDGTKVFGVIYIIKNKENGKVYVGQTKKGFKRRYSVKGEVAIEKILNYHYSRYKKGYSYNKHILDEKLKWIYYSELPNFENMTDIEIDELLNQDRFKIGNNQKVLCVTTGEEFNTVREAADYYKCSHSGICKVCRGKKKSCGKSDNGIKLKWEYIGGNILMTDERIKHLSEKMKGVRTGKNSPNAKAVFCITTNKKFDTAKEAADFYHVGASDISQCCLGKKKSCGKSENGDKLKWLYYKEYLNQNNLIHVIAKRIKG